MLFQTAENERVLPPMDTGFSSTLEGRMRKRVLQTSANCVICNQYSPDLPGPLVGFLQIYSRKLVMTLKSSVLVSCLMHAVLLNFSKEYTPWLTQSAHSLVAFSGLKLKRVKT